MRWLAPSLLLVALAGCREETAAAAPQAEPDPRPALAATAAEAPLRARLRPAGEIRQRGVQVFAQALPGTFAVCGRAAASHAAGEPFIPYVAVVAFQGAAPRVAEFVAGMSGPEAARVFVALADRCFEGGGPPSSRAMARAIPPLPDPVVIAAESGAGAIPVAASGGGVADEAKAALRSVVTTPRQGTNIRSAPRTGEVVRIAPRSSILDVYAEAPGGWLQVGLDGVPWGWMHASMIDPALR